jgi:hypothetical protein
MKTAQIKKLREEAVTRLMQEEDVCETDARMLVDVLGVDWSSLKRESDLMKVEANQARQKHR